MCATNRLTVLTHHADKYTKIPEYPHSGIYSLRRLIHMTPEEIITVVLGTGGLTALVSGIIQIRLWKLNRKAAKEDGTDIIKDAIKLILHDRIKYIGTKYINEKFVTIEDLRDLITMHEFYSKQLKGNGLLDYIMREVKTLNVRNSD
jgi:hypothetical protein